MSDPTYVRCAVLPYLEGLVNDGSRRGLTHQSRDFVTDAKGFENIMGRFNGLKFDSIKDDLFDAMGMTYIYDMIKSKLAWSISVTEKDPDKLKDLKAYAQLFGTFEGGAWRVPEILVWCLNLRDAAQYSLSECVKFLATSSQVSEKPMLWGSHATETAPIATITGVGFTEPASKALRCIRAATASPFKEFEIDEEAVDFISKSTGLVSVEKRKGCFFVRDARVAKLRAGEIVCRVVKNILDVPVRAQQLMSEEKTAVYRCRASNFSTGLINDEHAHRRPRKQKFKLTNILMDPMQCSHGTHVVVLTGDVITLDEIVLMFANGARKITLIGSALKVVKGGDGTNIMRFLGAVPIMPEVFPRVRVSSAGGVAEAMVIATKSLAHRPEGKEDCLVLVANGADMSELIREVFNNSSLKRGRRSIGVVGNEHEAVIAELVKGEKAVDSCLVRISKDEKGNGVAGRIDLVVNPGEGKKKETKHLTAIAEAPSGARAALSRNGQNKLGGRKFAGTVGAWTQLSDCSRGGLSLKQLLYSGASTIIAGMKTTSDELEVMRFFADVVVVVDETLLGKNKNQDGFPPRPSQARKRPNTTEAPQGDKKRLRGGTGCMGRNIWTAYLEYERREQDAGRRLPTAEEKKTLALRVGWELQRLCKLRFS